MIVVSYYPKNHGISKLVVWRSQNPSIHSQTPVQKAPMILSTTTWCFQRLFYFNPYLGEWSNLTNIFQLGLKPPATQLIISKLVHILSLGFRTHPFLLPCARSACWVCSRLGRVSSKLAKSRDEGADQQRKISQQKTHEHVKGDEHRFFCLFFLFFDV